MVKRNVVWSAKARIKLLDILEYYNKRNKSSAYSNKIYKKFIKELTLLKKHPGIGIKTDDDGIRGLIVEDFILFYETRAKMIIVHTVWDCRQNPESLIIK